MGLYLEILFWLVGFDFKTSTGLLEMHGIVVSIRDDDAVCVFPL